MAEWTPEIDAIDDLAPPFGIDTEFEDTAVTAMKDAMKSDLTDILDFWGETLTIIRATKSYDSGMATQTWDTVGTISGDWQPVSGKTVMLEASMETKSEAVVYCAVDVNVEENDKIQRPDGTYMYVNYIRKHEDHRVVHLKRNMR